MTIADDAEDAGPSAGFRMARLSITALLIIMVGAGAMGFSAGHLRHSDSLLDAPFLIVIGLCAFAVAALAIPVVRDIRGLRAEIAVMPSRERKSMSLMGVAVGLGVVGGLFGASSSIMTDWFTGDNRGLPPALAIGFAVLLVTLVPYLTWRWWRAIDEHEQAAYAEGANIAGHFALSVGIAWWVLSRAGLVPDPDVMVLVIAMSFVWTGVWLYRKFT